jgi:TonB family protein
MGARTQPFRWKQASRRRQMRYRLQAPLDVTVLRSGVPHTLPGRSVNLGEGGLGAVLAGELSPGESVGVEIWLPVATDPLRTRALVRHHDRLRSGMEFVGLSARQKATLRGWLEEAKKESEVVTELPVRTGKGLEKAGPRAGRPTSLIGRLRGWIFLFVSLAILLGVLWWRWDRAWDDLESNLPKNEATAVSPQAYVPADDMAKLIIHRVDPEYPAAARPENLQGVIVLDVVVASDGSVADVRAQNGPDVLAQAAMEALRWWRFEPYRVDGQPVAVQTTVAVEFKP